MVVAQPEDQLAFEVFAFFGAEVYAALRPPFVDAAVADEFAGIEESARIGAAKELLAPGAGADAEQAEGVLQPLKVEFEAGKGLFGARFRFVGHRRSRVAGQIPMKKICNTDSLKYLESMGYGFRSSLDLAKIFKTNDLPVKYSRQRS